MTNMQAKSERLALAVSGNSRDWAGVAEAPPDLEAARRAYDSLPEVRWEKVAAMRARLAEGDLASAEELADAFLSRVQTERLCR